MGFGDEVAKADGEGEGFIARLMMVDEVFAEG